MRWLLSLILLTVPTACSFDPVVTTNPLDSAEADGQVVSVCYRSSNTTREEIMKLAEERCAIEGSSVELWKTDTFLNECPVFLKRRVAFVCQPPARDDAVERVVEPVPVSPPGAPGAEVPGTVDRPTSATQLAPPASSRSGLGY